ncbi:MAG: flotillin-like protein FloA [Bacteroidota bacterium]|nr:flotillin-like protein FloA [Bacteroidota bacterium]
MEIFSLLILIFILIILFFIFLYFVPVNLWITAIFSGVRVGLFDLVFMRIRKVPPRMMVESLITATKAGLKITTSELETHYLAGGHVPSVIKALISAHMANIDLSFQQAAAIDLAGRDVFEAVQISVNPKVINTPNVTAVAQDGIQLVAKARITVRVNISRLVGGAGEETILARVGEGIVTSIGSSRSHKEVLENPDKISKLVLSKGLDAGTAYEILSIDIADVDVGANIGAKLQIDQASADLKVAEAKAEERRAMAVALEQEMKAKTQEAKAKLVEAEAEVPKAISDAFRSGNLGVMDYYKMQNVKADTSMRDSIAGNTGDDKS